MAAKLQKLETCKPMSTQVLANDPEQNWNFPWYNRGRMLK
jgi:hypothetical protein